MAKSIIILIFLVLIELLFVDCEPDLNLGNVLSNNKKKKAKNSDDSEESDSIVKSVRIVKLNDVDATSLISSIKDIVKAFSTYKETFGKKYSSEKEEKRRFRIFKRRMTRMRTYNSQTNTTYKKGVNEFSDMSYKEIITERTGYVQSTSEEERGYKGDDKSDNVKSFKGKDEDSESDGEDVVLQASAPPRDVQTPKSWDWRDYGILTPVRNQGKCGSCWSFAAACLLESYNMKRQIIEGTFKKDNQITVSEQNLIDCSKNYGTLGCSGGMPQQGWKYVHENDGVATQESYPYDAKVNNKCKYDSATKSDVKVTEGKRLPSGNDQYLEQAIYNYGPVAVAVQVTKDMAFYKEGIFTDETCDPKKVNHAVVAVGYGEEKGKPYFIIRNSWGPKWGEGGYIRISRSEPNTCGVSQQCYYSIVPGATDTVDVSDKFEKSK